MQDKTETISVRINKSTNRKIRKYSQEHDVSLGIAISNSIDYYLNSISKTDISLEQITYITSFMTLKAMTMSDEDFQKNKADLYQQGLKNSKEYIPQSQR